MLARPAPPPTLQDLGAEYLRAEGRTAVYLTRDGRELKLFPNHAVYMDHRVPDTERDRRLDTEYARAVLRADRIEREKRVACYQRGERDLFEGPRAHVYPGEFSLEHLDKPGLVSLLPAPRKGPAPAEEARGQMLLAARNAGWSLNAKGVWESQHDLALTDTLDWAEYPDPAYCVEHRVRAETDGTFTVLTTLRKRNGLLVGVGLRTDVTHDHLEGALARTPVTREQGENIEHLHGITGPRSAAHEQEATAERRASRPVGKHARRAHRHIADHGPVGISLLEDGGRLAVDAAGDSWRATYRHPEGMVTVAEGRDLYGTVSQALDGSLTHGRRREDLALRLERQIVTEAVKEAWEFAKRTPWRASSPPPA